MLGIFFHFCLMTFSQTIIRWYHKHKRDLPWRKTKDPYRIWLSEIILQQTRVNQGLPYYEKFVKKFPIVHHLAKAKEDEVMKLWQGLGYYSRARNLHSTAKFISEKLDGKFPQEYDAILKLKGIGTYTAGAIASFAFNKPHPIVDGNVFRLLSRYFGIKTPIDSTNGKKEFYELAESLLGKKNPALFNQAIMEFGALQCVPQNPNCKICPLKKNCSAFIKKKVSLLPVKSKKEKQRVRYFNYFIFRKNRSVLLKKRTGNDIWKNLYDFPLIETKKEISPQKLIKTSDYKKMMREISISNFKSQILNSKSFKHFLSHQTIVARFFEMEEWKNGRMGKYNLPINFFLVPKNQHSRYAVPRLIEKYFQGK